MTKSEREKEIASLLKEREENSFFIDSESSSRRESSDDGENKVHNWALTLLYNSNREIAQKLKELGYYE